MQIYGPAQLHGAQPLSAPHTSRVSSSSTQATSAPIQDELTLSDAASYVDQVNQMPEVRQDRVAAIRAQIAAGTYETDDKLDTAVNRLLDEIG